MSKSKNSEKNSERKKKDRKENLTPWKPGQSGNLKGRPVKSGCLTTLLKEELAKKCDDPVAEGKTWMDLIVESTMRLAIKGAPAAVREVWNRIDGKVPLAIMNPDGSNLFGGKPLSEMDDDELDKERKNIEKWEKQRKTSKLKK